MHYLIKVDYVCGNNSHLIKVKFLKQLKTYHGNTYKWRHYRLFSKN